MGGREKSKLLVKTIKFSQSPPGHLGHSSVGAVLVLGGFGRPVDLDCVAPPQDRPALLGRAVVRAVALLDLIEVVVLLGLGVVEVAVLLGEVAPDPLGDGEALHSIGGSINPGDAVNFLDDGDDLARSCNRF